jgi:flavin-dependent dehydrogenase
VALLTGSVPAQGFPSGLQILRRFAAEHGWVGPTLFGGSRVIPLRRPRDVIAKEGVALLGDAACQVFPAHGSGIGPGLVAASVLAEELSAGRGVLGYQLAWMRRWGGLLAAWDLFRRFSQTLSASDIAALMRAGLLDEAGSRDGLDQRFPGLHAHTLPAKLRGVLREPGKVAALAPILLRMAAVRALYARYPADPARLAAWSRRAARFCGDDPA